MRNPWLAGWATALTVAAAGSAQGADFGMREPPAMFLVPPTFSWTGFYLGANVGDLWGGGGYSTSLYYAGFPALAYDNPSSLGRGSSGVLGGAQFGYNWQSDAAVFGLETDVDWANASRSGGFVSPSFIGPAGTADFLTWNGSARLDWIGTTRLRAGVVATPDNRLMVYGTGGLAYGGGRANLDFYDNTSGLYWSGGQSNARLGWTVGAGVEYAITNAISLKAEYLYYNLGNSDVRAIPNTAAGFWFPNTYAIARVTYDGSIVRAGVNYKF